MLAHQSRQPAWLLWLQVLDRPRKSLKVLHGNTSTVYMCVGACLWPPQAIGPEAQRQLQGSTGSDPHVLLGYCLVWLLAPVWAAVWATGYCLGS